MLYNGVLASAVQQNESATHIQISPPFWISLPFTTVVAKKKAGGTSGGTSEGTSVGNVWENVWGNVWRNVWGNV